MLTGCSWAAPNWWPCTATPPGGRRKVWRSISGPFITALATAAGTRTTVIGKPAAAFFRQAIRDIGLPATTLAMVGDDAGNDLAPARRLGLVCVLVRTGKPVGPVEEALADVVIDSVAELRGPVAESDSVTRGLPACSVTVKLWLKSVTPGPDREGRRGLELARRRSCRARRLQHLVRLGQTEAQAIDVGEYFQQVLLVVELPYQRRKLAQLMQGRHQAVPRPVTTCGQGREGGDRRYRGVGGRKS